MSARLQRSWGKVVALRHITKSDYCVNDQQRCRANAMVSEWISENATPSVEEQINFDRILKLHLQVDCINNNKLLMDGTRLDGGTISEEDFRDCKHRERQLLPKLHDALDKALNKSGKTGQQKRVSEDVGKQVDIANFIYRKHEEDTKRGRDINSN